MGLTQTSAKQVALALIATLALLVQAFTGSAAMAAPAPVQTIQICTSHGLQTIKIPGAPDKQTPAPCPHCDHCLAPAAVAPNDLTLAVHPAVYATLTAYRLPAVAHAPYAARAPPRPPSQAPPRS